MTKLERMILRLEAVATTKGKDGYEQRANEQLLLSALHFQHSKRMDRENIELAQARLCMEQDEIELRFEEEVDADFDPCFACCEECCGQEQEEA